MCLEPVRKYNQFHSNSTPAPNNWQAEPKGGRKKNKKFLHFHSILFLFKIKKEELCILFYFFLCPFLFHFHLHSVERRCLFKKSNTTFFGGSFIQNVFWLLLYPLFLYSSVSLPCEKNENKSSWILMDDPSLALAKQNPLKKTYKNIFYKRNETKIFKKYYRKRGARAQRGQIRCLRTR